MVISTCNQQYELILIDWRTFMWSLLCLHLFTSHVDFVFHCVCLLVCFCAPGLKSLSFWCNTCIVVESEMSCFHSVPSSWTSKALLISVITLHWSSSTTSSLVHLIFYSSPPPILSILSLLVPPSLITSLPPSMDDSDHPLNQGQTNNPQDLIHLSLVLPFPFHRTNPPLSFHILSTTTCTTTLGWSTLCLCILPHLEF